MKTLHSIFHDRLIFKWVRFVITGILGVAGIIIFNKLEDKISWGELGIFVSALLVFISVLGIFFVNNHYPRNIKWLINQNYNRKDLMLFFFSSQSLKLVLSLVTILILLVAANLYHEVLGEAFSFFDFSGGKSYGDILSTSVFIIGFIYVLYIPILFSANTNEILQNQMKKSLTKYSKRQLLIVIIFFFLIFVNILSSFSVPSLFLYIFALLFICISVFWVINRTFKLYIDSKSYKIASIIGAACLVPALVLTLLMIKEVSSSNISFDIKKSSVLMLDRLYTDYETQEIKGFLQLDSSYAEFKSLLNIFKENLDIDLVLSSSNHPSKVRAVIDFYSKELSLVELKRIINFMEQFIEKSNNSRINFSSYSHSLFIKQKVPQDYIDVLVLSPSPYKQLAAVYFAHNTMTTEDFKKFIEENGNILNSEVLKNNYVIKALR